ncbi:MAG: hypothetical protein Q8N09_10665 [Thermodesulfovibrionia bacterium]|nr:hypothetical protein [Thermodesulfovibrionia bacterium]
MVFFDIKNNIIEDKEGEVVEIRTVPFIFDVQKDKILDYAERGIFNMPLSV